jgi:hypothetical protein
MDKNPQTESAPSRAEDTAVQLYWAVLETWDTQVDSYWTRTNYFAAFEIAAMAGTWVLLGEKDLTLGHLCLPLALVLTAGWIFSNLKSHGYVEYWWNVLKEIEARDEWVRKPDYVSNYETRRRKRAALLKLPYSVFTNWFVPIFFLVAWLLLLCFFWQGTTQK